MPLYQHKLIQQVSTRLTGCLLVLVLLCCSNLLKAQFYNEESPKLKMGVRVGMGANLLTGTTLLTPRPMFGFNGSFYIRKKMGKRMAMQLEGTIAYRGSKFEYGGDSDRYRKISLLYSELPIVVMYDIKGDQTSRIFAGAYGAVLLTSSIYVGADPTPEKFGLPVKWYDAGLTAGYLYSLENLGFMLSVKYGLVNINNNFSYDDVTFPAGS